MKQFGDQIFFYGAKDILSNMFPAKIRFRGTTLPTVEHLYVLMKAWSANDKKSIDKILREPNPYEVKKMGYGIQGLDVIRWDAKKRDIMTCAQLAKYNKPGFKEFLLGTGI